MNVSPVKIISAIFLTLCMAAIAMLYEKFHHLYDSRNITLLLVIIALLIITGINYVVLVFLFRNYDQRQIRKISQTFPEYFIQEENPTTFTELGEKITGMREEADARMVTMKEMENYRKEYLGNVAHELKTPLFSIQGYVETLMDGGVDDMNIRDKYLERIDKSVERILNIVQDLDMISRLESGQISLSLSKFDINILVRDIFDLLDLEAHKTGAKFLLTTSQNAVMVNADRNKISQVLINLLANAIHYANREKAQIVVNTIITGNEVLVEVKDNGMGIKPESLPRIFERFYRVESSRSRKDGGSGLGLAIVKHILEAHKKNIDVKSVYLEGTSFSFRLDLVK
ncbi:two-component system phosphate regulon sensor histidine kinase PhoR [Elizabethkingia sp. YR214]|uniref:sensor histidine kinase n=1 Tax=Elizabethkingia sp. YR214 TaxID=2135667 RepID=UPI000D316719|nr:ATP-binding protein [Elizabethkingia sp. YR214]PUB30991.1 two-component system phosphate regulon sensor histidine kinase PhoR [Elizabethkingia sp. YR214]